MPMPTTASSPLWSGRSLLQSQVWCVRVCVCVCVYVCVVCDVCLSVRLMPSVGPGKVKFSQSFATALFSFLYHLSSYQYSEWGWGTHPLPVYAHPSPRPTPHIWRV